MSQSKDTSFMDNVEEIIDRIKEIIRNLISNTILYGTDAIYAIINGYFNQIYKLNINILNEFHLIFINAVIDNGSSILNNFDFNNIHSPVEFEKLYKKVHDKGYTNIANILRNYKDRCNIKIKEIQYAEFTSDAYTIIINRINTKEYKFADRLIKAKKININKFINNYFIKMNDNLLDYLLYREDFKEISYPKLDYLQFVGSLPCNVENLIRIEKLLILGLIDPNNISIYAGGVSKFVEYLLSNDVRYTDNLDESQDKLRILKIIKEDIDYTIEIKELISKNENTEIFELLAKFI